MDTLMGLGLLLLVPVALYGLALAIGQGRCWDCRRFIPPWDARCVPCGDAMASNAHRPRGL
jgi:predicted amidophosphoribosyltransferase